MLIMKEKQPKSHTHKIAFPRYMNQWLANGFATENLPSWRAYP
jgi:hypothetical protein